MSGYVGRLAPSPTGALHLGNVRTFAIAWLRVRSLGGKMIMRMEDLDHPRDKPGAAAQAIDDLRWLGFDWDEEFVQSERRPFYRSVLAKLDAYPCVCSRRDVESAQSAPHSGEQLFYPGTCRGRFRSWEEAAEACAPRTPCWRFRVPPGTNVSFDDAFAGHVTQDVSATLGDFPLARDPDGAGYTLAATADDLDMGITEVVRGGDLLPATPPQILIARALGREPPSYCHVPLVVGPDGRRLAKRHGDTRIAAFRAAGVAPEKIIGWIAYTCGLSTNDKPTSLADLVGRFSLAAIPHTAVVISSCNESLNGVQNGQDRRSVPCPQA